MGSFIAAWATGEDVTSESWNCPDLQWYAGGCTKMGEYII